jgi:hypothetical protein
MNEYRRAGRRESRDVIFSYTNRNTDFTEKCFVRCDVSVQDYDR